VCWGFFKTFTLPSDRLLDVLNPFLWGRVYFVRGFRFPVMVVARPDAGCVPPRGVVFCPLRDPVSGSDCSRPVPSLRDRVRSD